MNTPELPSPRVSIVVPVYNEEEEVLPLLHKRLTGVLKSWRIDYEVILVDDGSQWIVSEAIGFRAPAGPERTHRFMNSPDVGTPGRGLGG